VRIYGTGQFVTPLPSFSASSFTPLTLLTLLTLLTPLTYFHFREKQKFFHRVLDILFLMGYFVTLREKPGMFTWRETELAGRNGVKKKCSNLKGGSLLERLNAPRPLF
jgi:hypothetical protein